MDKTHIFGTRDDLYFACDPGYGISAKLLREAGINPLGAMQCPLEEFVKYVEMLACPPLYQISPDPAHDPRGLFSLAVVLDYEEMGKSLNRRIEEIMKLADKNNLPEYDSEIDGLRQMESRVKENHKRWSGAQNNHD